MTIRQQAGQHLALLVALLAGCSGDGSSCSAAKRLPAQSTPARHQVLIGYGAPELTAAQAGPIKRSFVDRARARGWEVLQANAESDPQVQAGQVDYFIGRKVDAVVVVPVSSTGICDAVAHARRAGIPFFTIDRAPIGCEVELSVLSDNRLAGMQAGEAMVRMLTLRHGRPQGVVLEYQGDRRQNVAQLRGSGFHAVIDAYPGIRVISREARWDPAQVAIVTRSEMGNRDIEGVYLHSDALGIPVILPILKELGRLHPRGSPDHVFITGVDGSREALEAIRQSWADQCSSQPLPDFAIVVDYIERRLRGERLEEGVVTREGVPWSPAHLHHAATGWQLELATTTVTVENVDSPTLWANQP